MNDSTHDRVRLTSTLLLAGRQWRRLVAEALAADGISEARAAPLVWLGRLGGGVNQVTLAAHIGIEGTSLVRQLDQLSAAGLIERRDDPEDRRAKTLWLTAEGAALTARIEAVLTTLRARVFREVSEAELQGAFRVFRAIEEAAAGSAAADAEPAA